MQNTSLNSSYTLVGMFMQQWAVTEAFIDAAIARALELNHKQTTVVISLLRMRQKLDLLAQLVNCSIMPQEKKCHFSKLIKKIVKLSEERNVVAHSSFFDIGRDIGVVFNKKKAKNGELDFQPIIWSADDFDSRFRQMKNLQGELEYLVIALKSSNGLFRLAEAMTANEGIGHLMSPNEPQ